MELHNKIAQLSVDLFNSLPKTKKPNLEEWTILSTIVKHDSVTNNSEVVSLGTGSKCIGKNSMSNNGDILNDSHAEIIARRAFLKYLYCEIENFIESKDSTIFLEFENNKLILKNCISFHLFSTHVPCGDAAIFPKHNSEDFGNCITENNLEINKNKEFENNEETPCKKLKIESDIFRTGAKCLEMENKQDLKQSGTEYHMTGAIRTKPGRGDPTLSVSCSDKIAKWSFIGIQGALLSLLLAKPIYLDSITITSNTFSEEALCRAIDKRFQCKNLQSPYKHTVPLIVQSYLNFAFAKHESKQPCPSSIIWFKNCKKIEVAVEGKKQGVTKKHKFKKAGRLLICKRELFSNFINISQLECFKYNNLKNLNYFEVKEKAVDYQYVWNIVKSDIFQVWSVKNKDLLKFYCEI